jgi:hypothetical protein
MRIISGVSGSVSFDVAPRNVSRIARVAGQCLVHLTQPQWPPPAMYERPPVLARYERSLGNGARYWPPRRIAFVEGRPRGDVGGGAIRTADDEVILKDCAALR